MLLDHVADIMFQELNIHDMKIHLGTHTLTHDINMLEGICEPCSSLVRTCLTWCACEPRRILTFFLQIKRETIFAETFQSVSCK